MPVPWTCSLAALEKTCLWSRPSATSIGSGTCNLTFLRGQYCTICQTLGCAGVRLRHDTADSVTWRWTTNDMFSSATAYATQFEGRTRFDEQQLLWSADAPLKCRIFVWPAILGKCLTAGNLQKREWPHGPVCYMCHTTDEHSVHMLARCPFVQSLWGLMLRRCNLGADVHKTYPVDWWASTNAITTASNRKGWNGIVMAVWWFTRKGRNARIFRHLISRVSNVFNSMLDELRIWSQARRRKIDQDYVR